MKDSFVDDREIDLRLKMYDSKGQTYVGADSDLDMEVSGCFIPQHGASDASAKIFKMCIEPEAPNEAFE